MMASRAATSRRSAWNRLRLRSRNRQRGAVIPVDNDASQGTAEAQVDAALANFARNRQRGPVNDASRRKAKAAVGVVPSRKDKPCQYKYCFLPHWHSKVAEKDYWTPKHFGYQLAWKRGPANRHTKPGTGKTFDWVVPQNGVHEESPRQHWYRLRPHGDAIGPEVLSCHSVQPYKFYLMEEALNPACRTFSSGKELVRDVPRGGGQHMGELFFYWQLKNHTWRTYNPDEAQLVVVPFFPSLVLRGLCGDKEAAVNHFLDALEAFPRFEVNKGRDFAMVSTDFMPQVDLFWDKTSRFHKMTMNFIYVSRLNGKFIRTREIQSPNRCVSATSAPLPHVCSSPVTLGPAAAVVFAGVVINAAVVNGLVPGGQFQVVSAPYTSMHALSQCVGNSKDGMECPGLEQNEATFEDFMEKRNLTMFFMGQVAPR